MTTTRKAKKTLERAGWDRAPGLAFDPGRREERFAKMLEAQTKGYTVGDLRNRLRQAEAFANGDASGYAPQDPHEIMADVLSLLTYLGVKW